ncbi:uncharacterized protein LOC121423125 isoform X1 [Lytechinus variegatus]|uniref:uncharacterized protein LOC121423125 isoform X1 n=1 Tax=Lytechinus variegatus TaxID=7654 RepID=UPI001BB1D764|nr:uncharacterized protein LOC121423125 isoform X1 [Lytechinus variegatus]
MARMIYFAILVIVCAVSVSSSPAEVELTKEKVGYQSETGWKSLQPGNNRMGLSPQSIREKGRMLFSSFRQRSKTLLTMKLEEWKSAGRLEENEDVAERYRHVEKEAEYEIKQRIVDAMNGDEPVVDPDIPRQSEEITALFMRALFASTYAEQTSKEDDMMRILKNILENEEH